MDSTTDLQDRLKLLWQSIESSATKTGRDTASIRLIPASKGVTPEVLSQAYEIGLRVFGENRVQEAREKQPLLPADTEWHFIGGLQRNKAREAVRLFSLIHSVDTPELAQELDRRAGQAVKVQSLLIEVNVGGETTKHGTEPEDAGSLIETVLKLKHLDLKGFMTVAPYDEDLEKVRPCFTRLRSLRDEMEIKYGVSLPELSMGMSHDYQVAIEEGATLVRIGTALFGSRKTVFPLAD